MYRILVCYENCSAAVYQDGLNSAELEEAIERIESGKVFGYKFVKDGDNIWINYRPNAEIRATVWVERSYQI